MYGFVLLLLTEKADLTWEKIHDGDEESPSARYSHNAASARGGFIVFGGQLENGTSANDLWLFDAGKECVVCYSLVKEAKPGRT